MNVGVIIPVGPGHEALAKAAVRSVLSASRITLGPFRRFEIVVVPDLDGALGRSAARNRGMDAYPADWHFLLDADDEMMPDAFRLVDTNVAATFGAIYLNGRPSRENRHPVKLDTILEHGALGTLSMGCFVRGDLGLRFDESMDAAEDFDFYMRLPSFVKRREPLVNIGYHHPSAGGPRGGESAWCDRCREVIARYAT
jgi:glycosyltransferase involved in cell wall biosynthesis